MAVPPPLLRLPREIRDRIYDYVFDFDFNMLHVHGHKGNNDMRQYHPCYMQGSENETQESPPNVRTSSGIHSYNAIISDDHKSVSPHTKALGY